MFGVVRGAATGVIEREGYFQQAHGGTLFLDEVGELSLPFQAKLLRVLQDHIVPRVGGSHVSVDVRVVTATNNDLSKRIEEKSFRADLYYRIASIVLRVPSLRERKEDLSLLFHHFLRVHCEEAGKKAAGITLGAFELLSSYNWPGNVRELEHEVRRLIYLCPDGQLITPSLLPERIANTVLGNAMDNDAPNLNLESRLEELERQLILRALGLTKWNVTRTAKTLGVTRPGLMMKMERLGISKPTR
jgi:transcriptional regulator with PAS, ATPase and Fis domain